MTTKFLTGAYPGGYTLNSKYAGLVIESSASVGGTGVQVNFSASIQNYGTVDASSGFGITLAGGTVTNGSASDLSAMIEGPEGIYGKGQSTTIANFGTIDSVDLYAVVLGAGGLVVNGSGADKTAQIQGVFTKYALATVTNFGTISGRNGVSVRGSVTVTNGSPTDKRAVVLGSSSGLFLTYDSTANSGIVTNFGTIQGVGRAGIYTRDHATITNGSAEDTTALITGSYGILAEAQSTVINYGTIIGTSHPSVSGADRLIAESGSHFVGIVYGGGTLELAGGTGTISGLGASGTLTGAVTANFTRFGAYAIDATSSWTFIGTNTLTSAKTFVDNGAITNQGALTVDWTISGAGALAFASGTATINTGANVETASWSITGGTASLNETLDYSGVFSEGTAATVTIASGDRLILLGASSLSGTINGDGAVTAIDVTLGNLTLGGTARLNPSGTATQTGTVTIGDATASGAQLVVGKVAVYTIDGPVGIAKGASNASSLQVLGTLIRSGATGVSVIAVKTTDDGVVEAVAGTLDFSSALIGTGSLTIGAGATLQADKAAASTLSVGFTGATGTLALSDPAAFAATISGFSPGDTLDLLGRKASKAVVNGSDQLVITKGTKTVATLQLSGNYAGDTFTLASDGNGGTNIMVSTGAALTPHAFVAAMASVSARASAPQHLPMARPDEWRAMMAVPRIHTE